MRKITFAEANSVWVQVSGGYELPRDSSVHAFAKLLSEKLGFEFEECPTKGNHDGVLWCATCQFSGQGWGGGIAHGYKSVKPAPITVWRIKVSHKVHGPKYNASEIQTQEVLMPFKTEVDAIAWAKKQFPNAFSIETSPEKAAS